MTRPGGWGAGNLAGVNASSHVTASSDRRPLHRAPEPIASAERSVRRARFLRRLLRHRRRTMAASTQEAETSTPPPLFPRPSMRRGGRNSRLEYGAAGAVEAAELSQDESPTPRRTLPRARPDSPENVRRGPRKGPAVVGGGVGRAFRRGVVGFHFRSDRRGGGVGGRCVPAKVSMRREGV